MQYAQRRSQAVSRTKVQGRPGKWIFLAYIDHPTAPYVEAKKAGKGQSNIRCFDPTLVYEVSNRKGGPDDD